MVKIEIIRVDGLFKKFGRKKVLENVNFSVNQGEILALVGGSGEGKSVLIKTIIGFLKPTRGKVFFKGIDKKELAFSMQNNSLYEDLTLKQNWFYFLKLFKCKNKKSRKRMKFLLDELSLGEFKRVLVKKMSGGTKKRVDLGCALLREPKVLILDEPFAGLDPELVNNLSKYLKYLNSKGLTILVSSHRLGVLSKICDRVILLRNKKTQVVQIDKIGEIYK